MEFSEGMTPAPDTHSHPNVELEIVEVNPAGVLIINQIVHFRVKVTNNGLLPLDGVTLLIKGLNGATVANNGAIAPFVSEFITQELPMITPRGGSQLTVPLKFKAPAEPQDRQKLVSAKLEGSQASLDGIKRERSGSQEDAPPKATYAAKVRSNSTGGDPDSTPGDPESTPGEPD
ncbi:MAG TPA: hypothetical protein VGD58_30165 [Herpetosiphonaceae bacterium]